MSASRWYSKIFIWSFCFFMMVGFRVFPNAARWNIGLTQPTIWVTLCERPVMTQNNVPSSDVLSGQVLNFDLILQSVLDDYNNVASSYIRLVDAATDPAFDPVLARDHTISICFSDLAVGRSGQAGRTQLGGFVTGCEIKMVHSLKDSTRSFISVLTHELGHCMGLDHAQDTTHAIMSYFQNEGTIRLQIDDKMGLAYLYSNNPDDTRETSNIGFGCAPKN